jgi:hypothetical protein
MGHRSVRMEERRFFDAMAGSFDGGKGFRGSRFELRRLSSHKDAPGGGPEDRIARVCAVLGSEC